MVRSLLIRGMLVGILAGLLAFGFAKVFGEPQVDLAIAFEESHSAEAEAPAAAAPSMSTAPAAHDHAAGETAAAHDHAAEAPAAHSHGGEEELVSRHVQSTWGLLTGVMVQGIAIGGIFSLVFAFAQGRLGSLSPRATAGVLALAGFVVIVLVPQLKYPANPPAVGNGETIGMRTAYYFIMIGLSVLTAIAAFCTASSLAARFGRWNANLIAIAAYAVAMAAVMMILPVVNEVPADFSASVLWAFRTASLGIHVTLWTTLGLVFGAVAQRVMVTGGRRTVSAY
jgi:Probable cobalt transporter subunit (CbtA)